MSDSLSTEAPETPTLNNQVCFALYSASHAIMRLYRPLLDRFELTYPQYLVMLSLWREDEVSLKQLCEQTLLDAGTMTPMVKRLEAKGMLQRRADAQDERVKRVSLTDAGRALENEINTMRQKLLDYGEFDPHKIEQLRQMCTEVNLWAQHKQKDLTQRLAELSQEEIV